MIEIGSINPVRCDKRFLLGRLCQISDFEMDISTSRGTLNPRGALSGPWGALRAPLLSLKFPEEIQRLSLKYGIFHYKDQSHRDILRGAITNERNKGCATFTCGTESTIAVRRIRTTGRSVRFQVGTWYIFIKCECRGQSGF
jgi:hypothetical protein